MDTNIGNSDLTVNADRLLSLETNSLSLQAGATPETILFVDPAATTKELALGSASYAVRIDDDLNIDDQLTVTGATTLDGAVTLGDAATDTVTAEGAFTANSSLTVTGATTLDGAVTLTASSVSSDAAADKILVANSTTGAVSSIDLSTVLTTDGANGGLSLAGNDATPTDTPEDIFTVTNNDGTSTETVARIDSLGDLSLAGGADIAGDATVGGNILHITIGICNQHTINGTVCVLRKP